MVGSELAEWWLLSQWLCQHKRPQVQDCKGAGMTAAPCLFHYSYSFPVPSYDCEQWYPGKCQEPLLQDWAIQIPANVSADSSVPDNEILNPTFLVC